MFFGATVFVEMITDETTKVMARVGWVSNNWEVEGNRTSLKFKLSMEICPIRLKLPNLPNPVKVKMY